MLRILVLDDNPEALSVFEKFLKALDHEVHCFGDGREALLWLNDVKPQLIIADLDMPIMDGFDFLKRVRGYTQFVNVPIIALTGTTASDEEIAAGGFSSILRKPVTLMDIMGAIDSVMGGSDTAGDEPDTVGDEPDSAGDEPEAESVVPDPLSPPDPMAS